MSQTHEENLWETWENRQEYKDLSLKIKSQLRYDEKNLTECFQVINYFLNPNDDSRKDIMKYGAELSDLQRYEELYNELIDLLLHKKMEGFVDVKELSKEEEEDLQSFKGLITALKLVCLKKEGNIE